MRQVQCKAIFPEEACFKHDCYGKGRWKRAVTGMKEESATELIPEIGLDFEHLQSQTPNLVQQYQLMRNDPYAYLNFTAITSTLDTRNDPAVFPYDENCCRFTPTCFDWMKSISEKGKMRQLHEGTVESDRVMCCLALWLTSCRDKTAKGDSWPRKAEPPPKCSNPQSVGIPEPCD